MLPTTCSSMFRYNTVPTIFSVLAPVKLEFPILIFLLLYVYFNPFPETSSKFSTSFTFNSFLSCFSLYLFKIDFAIGWLESFSPLAKYSKISSSEYFSSKECISETLKFPVVIVPVLSKIISFISFIPSK